MKKSQFYAAVWKEGRLFVAKCLGIEIASQGSSRKEALSNLEEALSLYFEGENINRLSCPVPKNPRLTQVSISCSLYA